MQSGIHRFSTVLVSHKTALLPTGCFGSVVVDSSSYDLAKPVYEAKEAPD